MAPSGDNGGGEQDKGEQLAPLQTLESALEGATVATEDALEKRKRRTLAAVTATRCINAVGFGLVISSTMDLVYRVVDDRRLGANGGEIPTYVHNRVQKLQTNIMTLSSLLNFFILPFVGRLVDSLGRVPTFVAAVGFSGLGRLLVSLKPSIVTYLTCRVLSVVTMPIYLNAVGTMLGDLYGRGSAEFQHVSSLIMRFTMPLMVVATFAGGSLKPRKAFAVAGGLNLVAAAISLAGMQETLKEEDKKPLELSASAVNPLSFISFYRKGKALTALALLGIMREMGMFLDVNAVYQRRKFTAWSAQEDAKMMVAMQVGYFLSTFCTLPVMERFGLEGAHRLHEWVQAAIHLIGAFAPRMEAVYWGQSLRMFMAGADSLGRVMQKESELLGLGQGELQGAEANRIFFPQLVMPRIFTSLYMRFAERLPSAPYLLATALHIFAAEVGTPWAFKQLSPSVKEEAKPRSQREEDQKNAVVATPAAA